MTDDDAVDAAASLDIEARRLCPDGSCIGVVGDDGRCRVCGRATDEAEPGPGGWERPATLPGATGDGAAPAVADAALDGDPGLDAPDEERELCPDGSCIGLLGSDGRCKVCGRGVEVAPPSP